MHAPDGDTTADDSDALGLLANGPADAEGTCVAALLQHAQVSKRRSLSIVLVLEMPSRFSGSEKRNSGTLVRFRRYRQTVDFTRNGRCSRTGINERQRSERLRAQHPLERYGPPTRARIGGAPNPQTLSSSGSRPGWGTGRRLPWTGTHRDTCRTAKHRPGWI